MINPSDDARALIIKRFAMTGKHCRTAELIFFGGGVKGKRKGNWIEDGTDVVAPGVIDPVLQSECNAARALYLARSAA